jgi:hypothetical protein
MSHDNPFNTEHGRKLFWVSIVLLALWVTAVVVLGTVGYKQLEAQQESAKSKQTQTSVAKPPLGAVEAPNGAKTTSSRKQSLKQFLNRLYLALQLFLLHSEHVEGEVPGTLLAARLLAAFVELVGVCFFFGALVIPRLVDLREYLFRHRTEDHIVVCGLGRKGMELVRSLCESNRVVVIEKDDRNPLVATCYDLGAMVVVGDATKPETLRRAALERAKRLIAICGNDGTNIEISTQAARYLSNSGDGKNIRNLECHVHIIDLTLRSLMRKHKSLSDGRVPINIFNVFENGARQLFKDHFLDHPKAITEENDPRQVHLIVIGFGPVGESVVLQAVRLAHFPNEKKLRITIVDRAAFRKRDGFLVRYGSFLTECDASFRQQEAEDPVLLSNIQEWSDDKNTITTIVVCFEDDAHSLSYALTLDDMLTNPDTRIFVRIGSPAGVAELLARTREADKHEREKQTGEPVQGWEEKRVRRANLYAFGQLRCVCSRRMIIDEELNDLAKLIHDKYNKYRDLHNTQDAASRGWDELDPDLKESNWQQADHIRWKLRAVNCTMGDPAGYPSGDTSTVVEGFHPDEVPRLAKMEHRRWMTERRLAGWHLGSKKDVDMRTSPYMLPWDNKDLPVQAKNYDKEAIKAIPKLLNVRRIKRKATDSEGQNSFRAKA